MGLVNSRKTYLDVARALAIIFVVVGHIAANVREFFVITSPIKIPLFFIISGYLFKTEKFKNLWQCIKSSAIHLLIPYFFLGIIRHVNYVLTLRHGIAAFGNLLKQTVIDVLLGEELWFIPCLFLCQIFFWIFDWLSQKLEKATKDGTRDIYIVAFCVIGAVVCLCLTPNERYYPWHPCTALMMCSFFEIGRLYKKFETSIDRSKVFNYGLLPLGIFIITIAISFLIFGNTPINIKTNRYNSILLTLVSATSGAMAIFGIFKRLKAPRWLTYIGENTLAVYAFNGLIGVVTIKIWEILFPIKLSDNIFAAILIAAIDIAGSLVIAAILNRIAPWSVGKKRKAKPKASE